MAPKKNITPAYRALFAQSFDEDYAAFMADVIASGDAKTAAPYLLYFAEMFEEVFWLSQGYKHGLIASRVLGLTENHNVTTLDMNYLLPQEVAGRAELTYDAIVSEVGTLFARTRDVGEFKNPVLGMLYAYIAKLLRVVQVGMVRGDVDAHTPLAGEDLLAYVDHHNRAVDMHLKLRRDNEKSAVRNYRTRDAVLASKERTVLAALTDEETLVLAAMVYFMRHTVRFSFANVQALTRLDLAVARTAVQSLAKRWFIQEKSKGYYALVFRGLSYEDAVGKLFVGDDALSAREAIVFAAIYELCQEAGGPVRLKHNDLVAKAFNGHFGAAGGWITSILSKLEARDLLRMDTRQRPFVYAVVGETTPEQAFAMVPDGELEELNALQRATSRAVTLRPDKGDSAAPAQRTLNFVAEAVKAEAALEVRADVVVLSPAAVPEVAVEASPALNPHGGTRDGRSLTDLLEALVQGPLRPLDPEVVRRALSNGAVRAVVDGDKVTISFELLQD